MDSKHESSEVKDLKQQASDIKLALFILACIGVIPLSILLYIMVLHIWGSQ